MKILSDCNTRISCDMNSSHLITGWQLPDKPEIHLGRSGDTIATEVYLGNGTTRAEELREDRWNINTMLAICLGPLAVILLISYVIHWIQVLQRVRRNIKTRRLEMLELPHNKVSTMMTIQTLENERSGLYYDDIDAEENIS